MLRTIVSCVVTMLAGLTAMSARGDDRAQRIDEVLSAYTELGQFNGVALVADRGRVIFEKGYGVANLAWGIENTPATRFRIASITKTFTATLVMMLVEEGPIQLDATIDTYLPDYRPDVAAHVTVRHLLNHTSGLGSISPVEANDQPFDPEFPAMSKLVRWIGSAGGLIAEPGAGATYSNAGFVLLAAICESVTGQQFEDLVRAKILDPLGMQDTEQENTIAVSERLATGYRVRAGEWFRGGLVDMRLARGNGGLTSTARDLFRFDQSFYDDRLLSSASRELMFTPVKDRWGFAWSVDHAPSGFPEGTGSLAWHRGSNGYGYKAQLMRAVDHRHSIILLTNLDRSPRWEIAQKIMSILMGGEAETPIDPGFAEIRRLLDEQGVDAALARLAAVAPSNELRDSFERELTGLGLLRLSAGDKTGAVRLFEFLARAMPNSTNVAVSLAYAHALQGHTTEAIEGCRGVFEREPYQEDAYDVIDILAVEFEHPRLGDEVLRTIVEDGVEAALALAQRRGQDKLLMLGYRLMWRGLTAEAEQVFRYWVAVEPQEWNAYDSLGEVLMESGQLDEAARAYRRSIELNPDNDGGRTMLQRIDAREKNQQTEAGPANSSG